MPCTSKNPANLSDSLHRRLNSYALAATAAGVGVLCLARPGEAKIVYTKAHKRLAPNSLYQLDLDHDGIADFTLHRFWFGSTTDVLQVYADVNGNWIAGVRTSVSYGEIAFALPAGKKVSSKLPSAGNFMAAQRSRKGSLSCYGYWAGVENRFLGFKFSIKGSTHYGWARLNVGCRKVRGLDALLTGYAYETIPNKPIITGKTKGPDVITLRPGSLGQLAAGRK